MSRVAGTVPGSTSSAQDAQMLSFVLPESKILSSKDSRISFVSEKTLAESYSWYSEYGKHLDLVSADGESDDSSVQMVFRLKDNTSFIIKLHQSKTTGDINGVVTRKNS